MAKKDTGYKFVDEEETKPVETTMTVGQAITRLLENLAYLEKTTGKDASKAVQELGKLQQSLTEGQLNLSMVEVDKEVKEEKEN